MDSPPSVPPAAPSSAPLSPPSVDAADVAAPPPVRPSRVPHQDIPFDPSARPGKGLIAGLGIVVLAVAALGYAFYGTPAALRGTAALEAEAAASAQQDPVKQIGAMVGQLEARLQQSPNDALGWSMLGRSYIVLGRPADAVGAFQRAVALRPDDAQLLADLADATAIAHDRRLAGEPEALLRKALQIDPKNLKALVLSGTLAFDRGDFPGAVRLWESAISVTEPGSEMARNLQNGVAEARLRASQTTAASGAGPAGTGAASAAPADGATAASVSGRVELSAALQSQIQPGDTLFVFARAVDGPKVPLAILRKQARDLPLDFQLDDTMAMSPALRLSNYPKVLIGARISRSGNAMAQPGDLQGLSEPVATGARGVKIQIGEVVR